MTVSRSLLQLIFRKILLKVPVCLTNHTLWACGYLKKLSVPDRFMKVKESDLCFLCVKPKHGLKDCQSQQCGIDGCQRKHKGLLHLKNEREKFSAEGKFRTQTSCLSSNYGIIPKVKVIQEKLQPQVFKSLQFVKQE